MIRLTLSAAALTLAACTMQDGGEPAPTPPANGSCDAAPAQTFIGQRAEATRQEARRVAGAEMVRVYEQGQPITMDYREDRLNLVTNDQGIIIEVTCG